MKNYPDEAPKLSTLPFIIGDVVLIAAAAVIATRSPAPLAPLPLLAISLCVIFGAALLVVPFLANYARRQHAELDERQHQIAALARTTAESAEQLSIAAAGLHSIAQTSKENLEALAQLPETIQARIGALTPPRAGSAPTLPSAFKDELAQAEASVEKIVRSLAKLDTAAKANTLAAHEQELAASLQRATTRIDALVADAIAQLARVHDTAPAASEEPKPKPASKTKSRPPAAPVSVTEEPAVTPPAAEPAESLPPVASPEPVAEIAETPSPAPAPSPELTPLPEPTEAAAFAPSEPDQAEVPVDEPAPAKPPRARKPKADENAFDLGLVSDAQGVAETAVTSDGFTRLVATAYIGIGNRLFIRGDGPGLSWEKGVPLQFVSIGKWRW